MPPILELVEISLTPFDALLITLLAGVVAVGVRRGLVALVAGAGGLILLPVMNLLGVLSLPAGFLAAAAAGIGLAYAARALTGTSLLAGIGETTAAALGGLGGLLIGLGLISALALSFPTSPNFAAGTGAYFYPSANLAPWLRSTVERSAIARLLSDPPSRGGLGVWGTPGLLRSTLVPDRNRR